MHPLRSPLSPVLPHQVAIGTVSGVYIFKPPLAEHFDEQNRQKAQQQQQQQQAGKAAAAGSAASSGGSSSA